MEINLIFTADFKQTSLNIDNVSVFALEPFLKTKSKEYGWFYNDDVVLPVVFKQRKILFFNFQSAYFTAAFTGNKKIESSEEKELVYKVIDLLKKMKVDYIKQPMAGALFKTYPENSRECFFGTYRVDLLKDEDILFSEIHSKHRNVIRKAEKDGVVIKKGYEYIDESYNLIEQTYTRQNKKPITYKKYFEEINNLKNNSEIYISFYNDKPQTSAVIVYTKYSAYYLHGGMCDKPATGANNLLHWTAIKDMKEKGIAAYDFMGARVSVEKESKLYGVQLFKKRFSTELTSGYLWKYVINKKKYIIFTLLHLLRHWNLKEDSIDQERKKGNYNF